MTNTFDCQCCILMCKTSHYNIIMRFDQKDSKLLVEIFIDTLKMQEIESPHLFRNLPRNASYGYRRFNLIIKIYPWSLTLFFETFVVLYILYLTKRT